jgi:hypothetical protein
LSLLRARRDMVYAQRQAGWAFDRLRELHDNEELGPRMLAR